MRIAWFTPLSRRSAIARFSVDVTERLSRVADVHLWTDTPRVDRRAALVPVRSFEDWRGRDHLLRTYDHVVYNLGDHYDFHARMLPLLQRVTGVVILHDRSLHNLYAGVYRTVGGQEA